MAFTPPRFMRRLPILLLCFLLPISAPCARPDDAEKGRVHLEELASTLSSGVLAAGLNSLAVADFLTPDGRNTDLTWYVSGKLSDALRKNFPGPTGPAFYSRSVLSDPKITVEEMNSPEALTRIGSVWGVVAIITGTVEVSADKYIVKATVRNVTNGSIVVAGFQDLPHVRVLDLLLPEGIDQNGAGAKTVGADAVVAPRCLYCPLPGYSAEARAAKIQTAKITLMVTVSVQGQAIKVAVTKHRGFGFEEIAIEGVSEWKFSPAMQNGKPVAVEVPVEVEFRLLRT